MSNDYSQHTETQSSDNESVPHKTVSKHARKVKKDKRLCFGCGRLIPFSCHACPHCGTIAGERPRGKHSSYPVIASALMIISGLAGLTLGSLAFFIGTNISFIPIAGSGLIICGVLGIIFGILALIGGFYAVQRKGYEIAFLGAICSIFTGTIFGIVAIILIILGKDEFQ